MQAMKIKLYFLFYFYLSLASLFPNDISNTRQTLHQEVPIHYISTVNPATMQNPKSEEKKKSNLCLLAGFLLLKEESRLD